MFVKKKITPMLIEKYDITQKILKEFSNLESRHILFSIINKPKKIQEISKELKIPLSSVYKRMESLKNCSLVSEKTDFADGGQIVKYYQSKIKDVNISISKFEPKISFNKNLRIKNE